MADKALNKEIEILEQSVEALESRNAFQDDVIEQLNQELAIHQSQIAELKSQLKIIVSRIKENASGNAVGKIEDEAPPPHY